MQEKKEKIAVKNNQGAKGRPGRKNRAGTNNRQWMKDRRTEMSGILEIREPTAYAKTSIEIKPEQKEGRQEAKVMREAKVMVQIDEQEDPTGVFRRKRAKVAESQSVRAIDQSKPLTPFLIPVILETPFKGDEALNTYYARQCMRHCLMRGEAPLASHMLYTQPGVLRDDNPMERFLGIRAGFIWRPLAAYTVVYTDLGISNGMRQGIDDARSKNLDVVFRTLGKNKDTLQREQERTRKSLTLSQPGIEKGYPPRSHTCLSYWKVLMDRAHSLLRWVWPVRSASKRKDASSSPKSPPKDP